MSRDDKKEFSSKTRHDVKSALMRIVTFKQMVEQGFDFKNKEGQAYLAQLEEGIAVLREILRSKNLLDK